MARILIVEDELLIAEDLKYKLTSLGHSVVGHAMTGEGALDQVTVTRPELVLMDVRLRGKMSGIEAAERIEKERPIPILFVTAHASSLASTFEQRPHFSVISKPFTLLQIKSAIEDACSRAPEEPR